jgi:hypothetical protein
MRKFYFVFIATILMSALCNSAFAEQKLSANGAVSSPSPLETQTKDNNSTNSGNRPSVPDCTRPNADPRCTHQPPNYYPNAYRSRPVIINQVPAEPPIDTNSLNDNWEGCRTAKLGAMNARDKGDSDQANHLDEWLWKNCRSYSTELRQLEQNDM